MKELMNAVRAALIRADLWRDGAVLLAAVSGGCDSVALLHALCGLRGERAIRVHAVHVQHGLRGADSLEDERFARSLCESLNVPLTVENANLLGDMHTPGMETMARDSRRRIFAQQLKTLNADALLTAHHRDDQAETVLMHLLRGSGMRGLCGMPERADFEGRLLIRPFLTLPKAALRVALEDDQLPFREDGSNQEAITPRNALRLEILPGLEAIFPGASEHIARLSETLSPDEAFLSAEADSLYNLIRYAEPPLFMLRVQPLSDAHEAIRRRVLRRWIQDGMACAGLSCGERALSCEDTCALSALVRQPAGSVINLPCGLTACRERDWLHLAHQSGEALRAAPPQSVSIPENGSCSLAHITLTVSAASHLPANANSVILTAEQLKATPVLRTPQPEDIIRPFGAPGHKPLRRYFTDRKIDRLLRPVWPVLAIGNEVLWLPGLCASELARHESLPQGGIQLSITGTTPFNLPKE